MLVTEFDIDQDLRLNWNDLCLIFKKIFSYELTQSEILKRQDFLISKLFSYEEGSKMVINEQINKVFKDNFKGDMGKPI